MGSIWQIIKAIPQIVSGIKSLIQFWWTIKNKMDQNKNEKIIEEVENAKTPEEKQAALDKAAGNFGNN